MRDANEGSDAYVPGKVAGHVRAREKVGILAEAFAALLLGLVGFVTRLQRLPQQQPDQVRVLKGDPMSTATPIPVRSPLPSALSGTTAVLIGGSSGIGLAAGVLLRSVGARVLVGRDPDRLQAAVSRVRGAGPADASDDAVLGVSSDAGDEQTLTDAFDRAGHVDHVLVTAGGLGGIAP